MDWTVGWSCGGFARWRYSCMRRVRWRLIEFNLNHYEEECQETVDESEPNGFCSFLYLDTARTAAYFTSQVLQREQ